MARSEAAPRAGLGRTWGERFSNLYKYDEKIWRWIK